MCAVCKHRKRAEIDALIASGSTNTEIAGAFGLPLGPVKRHRRLHVTKPATSAALSTANSSDAIGQLEADLDAIVAEQPHDFRELANVARALLAHLRAQGRKETQEGPQLLDVLAHESWEYVEEVALVALAPHPAARESFFRMTANALLDAIEEYVPRRTPPALQSLVATLRDEAAAAPAGRARAAVSSALAAALSAQQRWNAAWYHAEEARS